MTQQETLVRSFVDLVLNKRQLRLLTDFVSLDILEYSPVILSAAHEAQDFAQDAQRLPAAFADPRISEIRGISGRCALLQQLGLSGMAAST